MFCRNCGNELPEGTRFCDKCGADQTKLNSGAATPGAGTPYSAGSNPYTMGAQPISPVHAIPNSTVDFIEKHENESFLSKLLKYQPTIAVIIEVIVAVVILFVSGFFPALFDENWRQVLISMGRVCIWSGFASAFNIIRSLCSDLRSVVIANAATKEGASVSSILYHMKKFLPAATGGATLQLNVSQTQELSLVFKIIALKSGGEGKKATIGDMIFSAICDVILNGFLFPFSFYTIGSQIIYLANNLSDISIGDFLLKTFIPLGISMVFLVIYTLISFKAFTPKIEQNTNAFIEAWATGRISDNWEEKSDEEAIPYIDYVTALANGEDPIPHSDASKATPTSTPSGFNPYASAQPMAPLGRSEFHGSTFGLIGQAILASLVTSFTLGLAAPWAVCGFISWLLKNTKVSGRNLAFRGTGGSLFGNYLKWWFLSLITFGIYGLFVPKKLADWLAENVTFV